jgi:CRP-like cAMP-binding protein
MKQEVLPFRMQMERFVTINDEEWALIEPSLHKKTVKKKVHFIYDGEVCDRIALIVSGSMRFYHVKEGEEITGYFVLEEEWVTSYKSFLKGLPSFTNIQALEDTEIIQINRQDLQKLISHPLLAYKMERFLRLLAEDYLCCYEDRVLAFVTQNPEERYLELLRSGKDVVKRIPQHYIANFLGITPVSLSRIRRRIMSPADKMIASA